jgi:hypothetical protein
MLEHSALLLRPPDGSGRGPILVADTGAAAGHTIWWSKRLALPGRGIVQVHEQGDEPLLCTVFRRWSPLPWYEVYDAEDRRVGRVLGSVFQDQQDRLTAIRCPGGAGQVVIQSVAGPLLAQLRQETDGTWLTFAAAAAQEPFVKMLLLAAALVTGIDGDG